MNGVHLRALPADEYAAALLAWLREQGIDWPEERVRATVPLVQEKLEKLSQYPDYVRFLFEPVDARRRRPGDVPRRRRGARRGRAVGGARAIEEALRALAEASGQKPRAGVRADPARGHGSKVSPGLFESLELLGRDESLARLRAAAG